MSEQQLAKNHKANRKFKLNKLIPYLFILPSCIIIVGFLFYPMATVFYYSFQHYDISAPFYYSFAGFDNFIKIFTDYDMFIPCLLNSLKWFVSQGGLHLVFGGLFSLLFNHIFK